MDWTTISAILSTIGQLPTAALVVITCVLSGIGIGVGMVLRDTPKYIYLTIHDILNFILRLKGKEPIGVSPENSKEEDDSHATKIFKIIEGGKSKREKIIMKMVIQSSKTNSVSKYKSILL